MFAGAALLISLLLGFALARTSQDVLRQSREAVDQGRRAVDTGRQLVEESHKVSAVVRMSLTKSTDYADNPELGEAFRADNQALQNKTNEQQQQLERQALALAGDALLLEARQRSSLLTIFGLLFVLVVALGMVGIIITHKVAGPVYKMTRYVQRLRKGSLVEPAPLRRGDDLVEFFEELRWAIQALRERQQADIRVLDEAILELGESHATLRGRLTKCRDEKQRTLDE
jgi:nitrogen fixation/metabolism regulation signal transduction histidine kinase